LHVALSADGAGDPRRRGVGRMNLGVVSWINRVQREAIREAEKARAAQSEMHEKLRQAEGAGGMELLPPAPGGPPKEDGPENLFESAYSARRIRRLTEQTFDAAVATLKTELELRRQTVDECRSKLEVAEEERTQTSSAAQNHKQAVAAMVAREIASLDDKGEGFQHGCAYGLGFGCLALALYIAYTVVTIFLGRQTVTDSPIGVVFLTLFVAPIGISVLLQLVFSLKRMMVESELAAKLREAEELCDILTDKADGAFRSKQPELARELEQSEKEAGKIEAALKGLIGEIEVPAEKEGGSGQEAADPDRREP
jgi:hypothetical protein